MKFNVIKEYVSGIESSISYLLDSPFTNLKFPLKEWFSEIKKGFEKELFKNLF